MNLLNLKLKAMKDKLTEIFKKAKIKVFNDSYKQIISRYAQIKEICSKKNKELECSRGVDNFEDLVDEYNKKNK